MDSVAPNNVELVSVVVVGDDETEVAALVQTCRRAAREVRSSSERRFRSFGESADCVVAVGPPRLGESLCEAMESRPMALVIVCPGVDVLHAVDWMERGAITVFSRLPDVDQIARALARAGRINRQRAVQWQRSRCLAERLGRLSSQERSVMELMLTVEPNKAIAKALDLSLRTVDRRRQAVLEKMEVRSVPELALLLGAAGFEPPT